MVDNAVSEKPFCVCLALCNEVVEDIHTRNKSLFSIFNGISAAQIPTMYPRLFVLASITNAEPHTPIRIAMQTPSGQEMLAADGETLAGDRASVTDFPLPLQNIVFPEAGVYLVTLMVNGELIAQRPFNVLVTPPALPMASA